MKTSSCSVSTWALISLIILTNPHHLQGTVLGAKFDDASVALGAALLANLEKKTEGALPDIAVEGSIGLSTAEIQAAREKELLMQVGGEDL